jgi:hypothetical protein
MTTEQSEDPSSSPDFGHIARPKKRRFLERYAETGFIQLPSRHASVSRATHLNWHKMDKQFAAAWEDANAIAVEGIDHEARQRAVEGTLEPVYYGGRPVDAVRRYSDLLLIFLLKATKPEKYRESYNGFCEQPKVNRETLMNEIHRKLARLARFQNPDIFTPSASTQAPYCRALHRRWKSTSVATSA